MAIDLTYLHTLHTDHETAITRHLIHHPEDEHHPLMALLVETLDSLAYAPCMVADEHTQERDYLMRCARTPRANPNEVSGIVAQARWHNHQALAARRAQA